MALIADDAADRVEQMLTLTARLAYLVSEETRLIEAREPPLSGELGEEKARLANAYRLELARIKHDKALIEGAPAALLAELRQSTLRLQDTLAAHEIALGAVKIVAEGLALTMAEEITRLRSGAPQYGAGGAFEARHTPSAVALDRKA